MELVAVEKRIVLPFAKTDDERRQVFGWGHVQIAKDGTFVTDHSGDYIKSAEGLSMFENAVYNYVLKSRSGDLQHERFGVAHLIESMMFTPEKIEKMGISGAPMHGWWAGFYVPDDQAWGDIQKGLVKMMSIVGMGERVAA